MEKKEKKEKIGYILAIKDHFKEGAGVIVAEVPVYTGQTLFSKVGHWPVGVSIVFLVCHWLRKKTGRHTC